MSKVKLNSQKRASLRQASIILFLGLAAVVSLALFTYSTFDPGPFNRDMTFSGNCANWAGCQGAWLADLVFGLIGYLGYVIPITLVVIGVNIFRDTDSGKGKKSPKEAVGGVNSVITAGGALLTLLAGAGLGHMLFDPYPVGIGGGVFGRIVAGYLEGTVLGFAGTLLLLLSLFFVGVTLVTDISWGDVTEKVGDYVIRQLDKLQNTRPAAKRGTGSVAKGGDTGLFSTTQDWLKSKTLQTSGVVSSLVSRLTSSGEGYLGRGAWRTKPNYMSDDIYREDPLFMDTQRKPEVQNATSRIKARPVQTTPNTTDAPLRAPDASFLQQPAASSLSKPTPKVSRSKDQAADGFTSPMAKRSKLTLPRLSLLNAPPPARERVTQSRESLKNLAELLITSLGHYGVKDVVVVASDPGPVITRFELQLPDGTKASKVSGLANDLARNLCVSSVRVVEVIPGRPTIGIEIPNENRDIVMISEMLESDVFKRSRSPLTLAMGKDIAGNPVVADLARMPHLLVAGTTGSGKSVAVNAMLLSLLYKATPEEVRLIMIDPKMLELSSYEHIPHLIAPVVTDMKEASNALRWCVAEMERRYMLMAKLKVRNIAGFNAKVMEAAERGEQIPDPLFDPLKSLDSHPKPLEPLPFIVVVVDEFADMMMVVGKKVEELIARLAQKARASGIHLILATQRPSVDVITGLIKANIPTRVAFQVSTKIDSRTILDQGGAEQLLGYGDMLYMPPGVSMPQRIHGALVTDQEVEDVATYLKQQMEPDYVEGVLEDTGDTDAIPGLELADSSEEADPLYDEAVMVVTESRRASISYLQRRLKVGYNRAARMIEDMEVAGVVSPVQGNGTREVLAPPPVRD